MTLDKSKSTSIFSIPDGEQLQLELKHVALGEAGSVSEAAATPPGKKSKKKTGGSSSSNVRTTLYCTIDAPDGMGESVDGGSKFTTVLCTLTPGGKQAQTDLDLLFNETTTFSIEGAFRLACCVKRGIL
jgi:hypothetical protein